MLNEIYLFFNGKLEIVFGILTAVGLLYFPFLLNLIHIRKKFKTLKKDYKILWDANAFLRISNKQHLRKIDDYQKESDDNSQHNLEVNKEDYKKEYQETLSPLINNYNNNKGKKQK